MLHDFSGKLFERANTNETNGADSMNNYFAGRQSIARLSVALRILIQRFGIQRSIALVFVNPLAVKSPIVTPLFVTPLFVTPL